MSLPPSMGTPVLLDESPTLMTSLTLITSPKALSSNTVTMGVRASTQEPEGDTVQSLTLCLFLCGGYYERVPLC